MGLHIIIIIIVVVGLRAVKFLHTNKFELNGI
jgi:hypothetical protein